MVYYFRESMHLVMKKEKKIKR